jgi:hypothetical protein
MLLNQLRGSEFPGDAKPRAVYMLFQSYSEYWPKLAQEHKDNLGVVCNEFLSELIDYSWPTRMREPLRREFLDPQMRQLMDKAQKELDLLSQDMHLEVQPYDPEYEEKLRNWQSSARGPNGDVTYSEAQEVLEKMLIYYELSAKSFIRNIIVQVIERHLLQGMYNVFESLHVLKMQEETILSIAAENRETRERRIWLKSRKSAIEDAKGVAAGLAMRKELRMYANEAASEGEETSDEDAPSDRKQDAMKQSNTASAPPPPQARTMRRKEPSAVASPQQTSGRPEVQTNGIHPSTSGYHNGDNSSNNPYTQTPTRRTVEIEPEEDYYNGSSSPPTTAPPPPPPRPEKVRPPSSNDAYLRDLSSSGHGGAAERAGYAMSASQLREARLTSTGWDPRR